MDGVAPKKLLVSLLGRLTRNVSVAGSAPTVEVIMMASRMVLVGSAATALKIDQSALRLLGAAVVATTNHDDDPGVIVPALVVTSNVTAAFIRLEAIMTVLVRSAANLLEVMASALVVASSVTVAFIWLEAIVDLVTSAVPPASSVGPRILVNVS